MSSEHSKRPSATKSGPGRYHQSGEPGTRISKPRKVRAYVALLAAWASKVVPKTTNHSDEHGAYTLIGKAGRIDYPSPRRKWLAGISAQRGY